MPRKKRATSAGKASPKPAFPKTAADLEPAPYNPRQISPENAAALGVSMDELGDISGIVFNVRTGRLVCGHKRMDNIPGDAQVAIDVEETDDTGTVGYGHMKVAGVRWDVRFVDWPEPKEMAANLAANSPHLAGEFTLDVDQVVKSAMADLPDLSQDLRLDKLLPTERVGDTLRPMKVERPIERVWILIGLPADRYADHAEALDEIAQAEEAFFDSTIR